MTETLITRDDAPFLAQIHADAFDDPWSASAIAEVLDGPGAFGFVIDDRAFVLCRSIAGEAEILTLAVRPADRRAGLATVLLETVYGFLSVIGATSLFLEVAEDNSAALALYAAQGFAPVGRRAGYYARLDGGVAARILRRDLNR